MFRQGSVARVLERLGASRNTFLLVTAALVGLLGGLGAIVFRLAIRLVQGIAYGGGPYSLDLLAGLPWWHVALAPAVGGLLVAPIVYRFARETRGHGVPEVMEAVVLRHGIIRRRIVAAKTLASAISIGSGGSVGREGPIVQIGSAIGSGLGQLLGVTQTRLRTLVGCGAAAGIAATFNAPVAGVLFALEIILGDFGVRRFTPIVISSVTATAVSRHFLGSAPAFRIALSYDMVSPFELLPYSILGIVAGLVGLVFIWSVYACEDLFERIRIPDLSKPVLAGLLIGAIGLEFPHIFGVGYESIESALNQALAPRLLIILVVAKLLATSLTLGSGGSGGVFAPSLFMGAVLGGALGRLFHTLLPGLTGTSGAYALVGMGAVVASATRAPLTSIMIIFEMTGDYKIILPLMFACILGNVVSAAFCRDSIYTRKLSRRGLDIQRGRDVNVLHSLQVRQIASTKFLTLPEDTRLGIMLRHVVEEPHAYFYVTNREGRFVGVVAVDDLRRILLEGGGLPDNLIIARDVMSVDAPRIREDDPLDRVMRLFAGMDREELPVVQGADGDRIVGVVTRQALIATYNNEVLKRDAMSEVAQGISTASDREPLYLSSGIAVLEVEAPSWMVGRSLLELALRKTRGIQVLLVFPAGGEGGSNPVVPNPETTIAQGDRLVLLGPAGAIRAMQR